MPATHFFTHHRGLETDVERLKQLEAGGAYVISCAHNEQACSGKRGESASGWVLGCHEIRTHMPLVPCSASTGPEHINSKFGSPRFLKTLQEHFWEMIEQPMRIDTLFLDWHWLQGGGDHYILGYLSGSQGSKAYHLLKTSIPELVKEPKIEGLGAALQHVYLPLDAAGLMAEALQVCQPELVQAGLGLELMPWDDRDRNPLYNATTKVDELVRSRSSRGYGTQEHLELYCNRTFPFAHLYATRGKSKAWLSQQWDRQFEFLAQFQPLPPPGDEDD